MRLVVKYNVFSLWNTTRDIVEDFHSTIKFTAKISETENCILGHKSVQRRQIPQGVYP